MNDEDGASPQKAPSRATQQILLKEAFNDANPLLKRLGKEFFRALPSGPGVYFFKSAGGEILYIGKAKNLKNRLCSYKNARPNIVSRKVVRLLRLAHSIEVQLCENETAALLTENQLLREHQPPFNVLNTHPETYYFMILKIVETRDKSSFLRFQLTTNPDQKRGEGKMFGVFKGKGRTRRAFQALLRLLSALDAQDESFYFPTALVRYRTPYMYLQKMPSELVGPLYKLLGGHSRLFINMLTERLLSNLSIPRFVHHVITEDLKTLEEFYLYGPRRVMRLKRAHGIKRRVIAQDEIDDLLILEWSRRNAAK